MQATTTPNHHHVQESEHDDNDEGLHNGDISKDLNTSDEHIKDPIDERQTLAEKNSRLQDQLKVSSRVNGGEENPEHNFSCFFFRL